MYIEKLLENKKGVILVGMPNTGEILAAASAPDYSPDLFTGMMTENKWKSIKDNPDTPLINRYIQGTYIPRINCENDFTNCYFKIWKFRY